MPSLALEIPVLALLGASAVTFAAAINSSLQLAVEPQMRGRVMALYSVVFLGSTPIGGTARRLALGGLRPARGAAARRLGRALGRVGGTRRAGSPTGTSREPEQRREDDPAGGVEP